jgi:hypothetical protein
MILPADPPNDRRTVPRHIRDGEHDMLEETLGSTRRKSDSVGRRARLWIYLAGIVAAGVGLWFGLLSDG